MSDQKSDSKSFAKILGNATVLSNSGNERKIKDILEQNSVIGLYFSAHWCSPCRAFTPILAKCYEEWKTTSSIEIIYVFSDNDKDEYKEYVAKHPWKRYAYADKKLCEAIMDEFHVKGIPQLIIFDKQGNLITRKGKEDVQSKGVKAAALWEKQIKD